MTLTFVLQIQKDSSSCHDEHGNKPYEDAHIG